MRKVLVLVFVSVLFVFVGCNDKEETNNNDEELNDTQKDDIENDKEDISWDDVKDGDKIIGKSDKDFSDISKSKPSEVRNDKTANWRKSTISENVDIVEYLLSYSDLYMEDDEVHYIINFNYNTTTVVNKMDGLLYADVKEYEEKEEHDASTIGSGMLLGEYIIYPDGDIEEIKSDD